MNGLRGNYRLNDSLRRHGLREVSSLPGSGERSQEDILRLAFTMIDPLAFPSPSWMLTVEEIDLKTVDHARLLANLHRESVEALSRMPEKLAYFAGALDALAMMEAK